MLGEVADCGILGRHVLGKRLLSWHCLCRMRMLRVRRDSRCKVKTNGSKC